MDGESDKQLFLGEIKLSSCFLGQVTGLFFCLYVKIFASSVYALFDLV